MTRGVEAVDRLLEGRVPPEQIEAMRSALIALTGVKEAGTAPERADDGPRQLRRFSPIFGVRDLRAALTHYTRRSASPPRV